MVLPIIAAKEAVGASKALTGDIYTRRWTSVYGKGKKKKLVEHEVRVNAVTGALVAVGAGATALTGMAALWLAQRKIVSEDGKTITMRCHIRPYGKVDAEDMRPVILTFYRNRLPIGTTQERMLWGITGVFRLLPMIQRRFVGALPAKYEWTAGTARTVEGDGVMDIIIPYSTDDGKTYGIGERSGFGIDIGGGIFG